jgi:hypothetical protein
MTRYVALLLAVGSVTAIPLSGNAGEVARAVLTTAVVEREPGEPVSTLSNDHDRIYFFTELNGLEGATVTHRWEWNGQVMAAVPFEVGGPRWRVYSSKNLEPVWLGEWTVSVIDASGQVLASGRFTYALPSPGAVPDPAVPDPAPADPDVAPAAPDEAPAAPDPAPAPEPGR